MLDPSLSLLPPLAPTAPGPLLPQPPPLLAQAHQQRQEHGQEQGQQRCRVVLQREVRRGQQPGVRIGPQGGAQRGGGVVEEEGGGEGVGCIWGDGSIVAPGCQPVREPLEAGERVGDVPGRRESMKGECVDAGVSSRTIRHSFPTPKPCTHTNRRTDLVTPLGTGVSGGRSAPITSSCSTRTRRSASHARALAALVISAPSSAAVSASSGPRFPSSPTAGGPSAASPSTHRRRAATTKPTTSACAASDSSAILDPAAPVAS